MASPFQGTVPVIKVEDERDSVVSGQVPGDQELMDMFRKGVQRRLELRRKGLCASGSAQPPPPPPPPAQQLAPPPPPPPPPAPAHHPWVKRPAPGPPLGLAAVRQPPQKQYQRKAPWQRATAQPQQPAAPNNQRTPAPSGPPPLSATTGVPPANVSKPTLQRRSAPKPPHAAAKKKPTVPCVLCGVLCMTAWHLKDHEQGRKHRNKVACLAGKMNVRCQVCNVHLSGGLNVEQHYAGKQHIWRLNGGT